MEKVNFKTSDGVMIVANWFPAEGAKKCVLLLHMRPATKESWDDFAAKLNTAGFSALAIDLRGHGESTEQNGEEIDYKDFSHESHEACRKDVDAALDFLKNAGVIESDIYVAGGSIGANLAIDALARRAEIKKGAALSPGLEYLDVKTAEAIKKLGAGQKILLVASKDDSYGYDSAEELHKLNPGATELKLYDDAGHANHMFEKYPILAEELIEWLKE
jgi:alpha-beta hydrolase superfamily lysophospholipase